MMDITAQSRLLDLLDAFPELEEQIIHIAPVFKNLKNPVLRRTVGRLATLEKVAEIGGVDAVNMVNTLRLAVGQAELAPEAAPVLNIPRTPVEDDPSWTQGEPQFTVDGTDMLRRGEVPLGRINDLLTGLVPGGYVLLVTDFEPTPILEAMAKQGRSVHHRLDAGGSGQHLTFIQ